MNCSQLKKRIEYGMADSVRGEKYDMKIPLTVIPIALIVLLSGCILPIPHRRLHEYGVRGTVLDAESNRPVALATISLGPCQAPVATTDGEGRFELKPVHGWHGAYLISPLRHSLFPAYCFSPPVRTLSVFAAGYKTETYRLAYQPDWTPAEERRRDGHTPVNAAITGEYMNADILLRRSMPVDAELPSMARP